MAPEMYDDDEYTANVDVFSFGGILFEVVFRRRGFSGNPLQIMRKCMYVTGESLDVDRQLDTS